jgi:acyl transferase domain-containing protein
MTRSELRVRPTDVAIIGLACRFPGAANSAEFWRVLCDGLEVTRMPGDVADFDAAFFNLSPREARAMDPRQRLALELTWELFEDAFVVPATLCGEQVSVYLGAMNDDYAFLTAATDSVDHHSFTGISRALIANRISFAFGLQGPSMTVDSGQSSSLVAVHLACENLRTGASPLAIAGGVQLNLARQTAMLEGEFGAISPSGHTYAFDDRADGYVRGEGGALVLLKPLRAALDDGDRIHAVIRGSAVGNAGNTAAGLTVTSVPGEVDVMRRALVSAGVDVSQVDYVEAHGTGTKIGDPIEARALGEIYAQRRDRPVSVGSVKTNIGHAGGAAGIAGLIKTVLAVENGLIPPSLNYAAPAIDLENRGLRINTTLTPWPSGDGPRRAGVSSFGMGGTNAHVIVEEPPDALESVAPKHGDSNPVIAWVVSGRSAEALRNQAGRLLSHLGEHPELDVADVAWSLAMTRAVFEHRAVLVGADREQLTAELAGLATGEPRAGIAVGRAQEPGKTAFVFPGHDSQWLGIGQQLHGRFPVFARAFDEAVAELDAHLRLPLRQVIWGGDAPLSQSSEFAQPATFAVQVALAALLRSCGVVPDLVLGHSVGEIAAAHVAGALSLADAANVVAVRGRSMAEMDELAPVLSEVSVAEPRIALVSSMTGQLAGRGYGSRQYWAEHVREPARFADAVQTAQSLGAAVFVEVGPGGALTTEQSAALAVVSRDRAEVDALLSALGRLFTAGVRVDWVGALGGLGARRVELPTYGFVRQRFWLDTVESGGGEAPLAERLRRLTPSERHRQLAELVCAHAATVLGRSSGDDIDSMRTFHDLGFNPTTGVELRNRLEVDTGLAGSVLSRTLIFDYPTPTALADHLAQLLLPEHREESDDEKLWSTLRKIPLHELRRTGLLDKLLLMAGMPEKSEPEQNVSDDIIDALSPDALIAMALNPTDENDTA